MERLREFARQRVARLEFELRDLKEEIVRQEAELESAWSREVELKDELARIAIVREIARVERAEQLAR